MSVLDELERGRARIIEQMGEIDKKLSRMVRCSPGRADLIDQKGLLLRQLREQKLRIAAAKASPQPGTVECRVSDHALVRWLERRHGIDVDRLKAMILTDGLRTAIRAKQGHWSDGRVVYAISDCTVVTVLPMTNLERMTLSEQTGDPTSGPPATDD